MFTIKVAFLRTRSLVLITENCLKTKVSPFYDVINKTETTCIIFKRMVFKLKFFYFLEQHLYYKNETKNLNTSFLFMYLLFIKKLTTLLVVE